MKGNAKGRRRRVMHTRFCVLSMVCVAVSIASFASPRTQTPPQTQSQKMEQEVKAVEQRWLENEDRPDVVQSILADDFVHVLPVGFVSKEDQLAFLRKHPNAFPGSKHFEELRVRIYGDVAIATGIVS